MDPLGDGSGVRMDEIETAEHGIPGRDGAEPRPERLDVLVVGGGPAGTAAALRARELGLSVLVIERAELMRRIRDYPKNIPIQPHHGGTEREPFASGAQLVARLPFEEIDKDELVDRWRSLYAEFELPAKEGCELQALEPAGAGAWEAIVWNHRARCTERVRARCVVLAVGAGIQRRLDIPGDLEGIAYGVEDAEDYVGAPTLVVGGGPSAAEAVLAISRAKARRGDAASVFWSYRGRGLPAVSKDLADALLDAFVRNGNIRTLPLSDPVAVVVGPDKQPYVSVRVDRKPSDGVRPGETLHYEFPRASVVACIGADPPLTLLRELGALVPELDGQPRMLVDAHGQTSLPGVYLVGDGRGLHFLRCTDFEDPGTWEAVTAHRNIKTAIAEAVAAVDAIGERAREVPSSGPDAPAPERAEPRAETATRPAPRRLTAEPTALGDPSVRPPTGPTPAATTGRRDATLVLLTPAGDEADRLSLHRDVFELGRSASGLAFSDDVYLEPVHTRLRRAGGSVWLEDAGSASGTWLRVQGALGTRLEEGDQLWLSRQLLEVLRDGTGGWQMRHYGPNGEHRGDLPVPEGGVFIGRASDWPLDPDDGAISKRHAQLVVEDGALQVIDRGARNGTYLRLRAPVALRPGDEFRIGTQRLRFERTGAVDHLAATELTAVPAIEHDARRAEAGPGRGPAATGTGTEPVATPAADAARSGSPAGGSALATLVQDGASTSFRVDAGQSLLSAYKAGGGDPEGPLAWECEKGVCGYCAIEILEGSENVLPCDPESPELATLRSAAMLPPDPQRYRLACLARIAGPVKLAIPD